LNVLACGQWKVIQGLLLSKSFSHAAWQTSPGSALAAILTTAEADLVYHHCIID
jgi:hypothetical protein